MLFRMVNFMFVSFFGYPKAPVLKLSPLTPEEEEEARKIVLKKQELKLAGILKGISDLQIKNPSSALVAKLNETLVQLDTYIQEENELIWETCLDDVVHFLKVIGLFKTLAILFCTFQSKLHCIFNFCRFFRKSSLLETRSFTNFTVLILKKI